MAICKGSHVKTAQVFIIILMISLSGSIFAQGVTTASVNGNVKDNSGQVLAGANVVVVHEPSGTVYGASTHENGRYYVQGIRVGGPYTITVSFMGYSTKKQENVFLGLGQDLRFSFELEQTTLTAEAIIVEAEMDKVMSPDKTGASTNIDQEQLETLPTISRSAGDIYRLTPQASGNSFGGRNNYYNNFSLDGSIFNNSFGLDVPTTGGQTNAQPVSLDAIEQIQINIAPFDVRQGGFTGAGINSVTRSGTNIFSGSVYNFTRNEKFIGENVNDTKVENLDLTYRQSGFRFGGPIKKDKLFFFINAEQERRNEPATSIIANDGSATGANVSRVSVSDIEEVRTTLDEVYGYKTGDYQGYDHKTENDKFLLKLDWNISNNHNATFRYNRLSSWRDVLPHPAISAGGRGPSVNSIPFENTSYEINNDLNSFVGELNSRFSNKYANHVRLSYTSFRDYRNSKSEPFPSVDINQDGSNYISFGLERFSTNNLLDQDVLQFTDDFTTYFIDHVVTVGVSYESFKFNNSFNLFFYPGPSYANMDSFRVHTDPDDLDNFDNYNEMVSSANQNEFKMDEVDLGQLSFYAQDEWQYADNIILTYGLRLDMPVYSTDPKSDPVVTAETFYDDDGNEAEFDPGKLPDTKLLWSPRIGFNWDVNRDRTLQLRGGTGIFTGRLRFVWISNQISNGFIAPFYTFQLNATHKDFKWPQSWRTNLGIDKKLPYGLVGTLEGIYSKDINAVVHKNYNMLPPSDNSAGADDRPIYQGNEAKVNGFYATSFLDAGAIMLENTDEGYQYSITGKLRKEFTIGVSSSVAYTFSESKDITSSPGEIAADAFQLNPTVGNVNKPTLSYSDFGLRHRLIGTASYKKEWNPTFATTISAFLEMGQGDRFSYVYAGDMNLDGIPQNNDLMYIPKSASEINLVPTDGRTAEQVWQQLDDYIDQDDYLSSRRGKYAERNGALGQWFSQLDIRILQDFNLNMGKDSHKFQLSIDILNLGNMINNGWGVRKIPYNKAPLTFMGYVDGEPTFSFPLTADGKPLNETFIDYTGLSSRWQAQIGIRYLFN
ncbi:MAG: TonB-dependent receptor [Calditrichia bacterium]|nr:TonB-dependent receptor [Calditrichia bacterium]